MASNTIVVQGTLNADGRLELAAPIELPPGPVEITVRPIPPVQGEDLVTLLTRIRAERQASGYRPRTKEEIDADPAPTINPPRHREPHDAGVVDDNNDDREGAKEIETRLAFAILKARIDLEWRGRFRHKSQRK